jgi:hypothetical protein
MVSIVFREAGARRGILSCWCIASVASIDIAIQPVIILLRGNAVA